MPQPTPRATPPPVLRQLSLPLPPLQGPAPPLRLPDLATFPPCRIWSTLAPSLQAQVRLVLVQVAREVLAHDARTARR
jgi:hypothetical protein